MILIKEAQVTWAALVTVPEKLGLTNVRISTCRFSPGERLPRLQVTFPLFTTQAGEDPELIKVSGAGRLSDIVTPTALEGPGLVVFKVYVR